MNVTVTVPFEAIALFYSWALAVASPLTHVPIRRRLVVAALCLAAVVAIEAASLSGRYGLRAWLPHLYLVAGYWLSGLLANSPNAPTRFERWLLGTDAHLRPLLPRLPAPLVQVTELAYLLCYPLIPVCFTVVWLAGTERDVSAFWVAVLTAGFACYGTLPWLLSRPPRLVTEGAAPQHLGAVNAFVLGRVSHQLNTFPSGHVAVSFAAAAMVAPVSPAAALLAGVVALAVAVGAVAGRYHYVVDVLCGAAVAALAVALALTAGEL